MQMLDDAIFSLKDKTGLGVDSISPCFLKRLPWRGRVALLQLLRECGEAGAWPWQALVQMATILPKPNGGERTVFLINMLQRIWMRMHKGVSKEWCAKHARFWDDAVAGSSALRAAVLQLLSVEIAEAEKQHW
eukprot:7411520-Karenia_brevis.AAC.1